MRERLIELIAEAVKDQAAQTWEEVADYLLDNGVIVLPCKVGDYVYKIHSDNWRETFKGNDEPLKVIKSVFMYKDIPHFGKLVFLTKEEAEAKLNALKGE